MRSINVQITEDKTIQENIYDIKELSYLGKLLDSKDSKKYDPIKRRSINYIELPCAFDIETTNITAPLDDNTPPKEDFRPFAFMYHWQFCLEDQVVFGRTWEEFQHLLKMLEANMNLSLTNRLVVWVHNLAFEWQFMRNFIDFEEGFFLDERQPARILTKGGIEFRCSYVLSNMSLSKFCENEVGVIHFKLDGDTYNYDKLRTPYTPMEEYEESYCYNDVRGLCECIRSRLRSDTLAKMPMTSTGYVRRDLRNAVRANKKNRQYFLNSQLTPHLYDLCREAFRGGDTHANSERSDQINNDAWSYDIKSSYPAAIMEFDKYPFSAFSEMPVSYYLNNDMSGYALILKVAFKNIKYDKYGKYFSGMPYIALAKCNKFSARRAVDNGRILFAEFIELTITNLDLEIILNEYVFDDFKIGEIWASKAGMIAKEIRETTLQYFRAKTLLDGIENKKYEYMKAKNKLNSIYGCCVMRIDQPRVIWDSNKKIYVDETPKLEDALVKFYKSRNNFLQYQQGLFITAVARKRLRDMIWKVGADCIYCDTDSIKGVGDHHLQFDSKNEELKKLAIKCGAYAPDRDGNIYYMGVWENETAGHLYDEFKTLGAKKYVYRQGEKIKSTIAGVSKKAGAEYFKINGVDALKKGAVITNSGHLTAYYNDDKDIHTLIIDHLPFTTSSNVALVNSTYKIGITEDYADLLLKGIEKVIDMA